MLILFCEETTQPGTVDSMFLAEREACVAHGLAHALLNFEALLAGDLTQAIRRIPPGTGKLALFRGWMMRPAVYASLESALRERGWRLINSADQYRHAHHLPEWYPELVGSTPRSSWTLGASATWDVLQPALAQFGSAPVVVKDYVKSRKHEWHDAFFIPSAADRPGVERVVGNFVSRQGADLNEGLVFREFVELAPLAVHPKSGMPLSQEFRIFFLDHQPLLSTDYWPEVSGVNAPPPIERFIPLAERIGNRFFTMDVARLRDGSWTVMEIGDGQVSGLPSDGDAPEFYRALAERQVVSASAPARI